MNTNPSLVDLDSPINSIVKLKDQFLPDIKGAKVETYPYTLYNIGDNNKK